MRITSLLLTSIVFLFLFIFSSPVMAYLPISSNTSFSLYTQADSGGMQCILGSDSHVYCYVTGYQSVNKISRLNMTAGTSSTCNIVNSGTGAHGLIIINETTVGIALAGSYNGYCYYYDTTNIGSSTCTLATASSNASESCAYSGASNLLNGMTTGDSAYWPIGNVVFNVSNVSDPEQITSGLWTTGSTRAIIPNASTNSTYYIQQPAGTYFKYESDVYTKTISTVGDLYGTGGYLSLIKNNASTTTGYVGHYLGSSNFYVYTVNWTYADDLTVVPVITAVAPINNASAPANPPQLHLTLDSDLNGTLVWTVDGSNIGSTAFVTNGSVANLYFTPSTALLIGYHNWSANFTDTNNNSWLTGNQYMQIGVADFFSNPLETMAQQTGYLFSVHDLSVAKDIFAVLFSLFVSVGITIILALISKGKMDFKVMAGLVPILTLILLVVFGLAGFLSLGMGLLIGVVVLIFIFYMVKSGA